MSITSASNLRNSDEWTQRVENLLIPFSEKVPSIVEDFRKIFVIQLLSELVDSCLSPSFYCDRVFV